MKLSRSVPSACGIITPLLPYCSYIFTLSPKWSRDASLSWSFSHPVPAMCVHLHVNVLHGEACLRGVRLLSAIMFTRCCAIHFAIIMVLALLRSMKRLPLCAVVSRDVCMRVISTSLVPWVFPTTILNLLTSTRVRLEEKRAT